MEEDFQIELSSLKIIKNKDYKGGWIIGDFEPSLFKTNFCDIGVLHLKKGEKGDGHFHKIHREINYIISGVALLGEEILVEGDCFVYEPMDRSYVEYLEDTIILCFKTPSTKKDKYYD